MKLIYILAFCGLLTAAYGWTRPAPNVARANMLFAPCPLSPQNIPQFNEDDDV